MRRLLSAGKLNEVLALVANSGEQLRVNALVDLAQSCAEDQPAIARELLEQALARSPQHDDATWMLAWLDTRAGRPHSSIERLRALYARYPRRIDVIAALADQLIEVDSAAEAETLLAPAEQSAEPRLLCLLGKARFAQGRMQEALSPLERAMALYEQLSRSDPFASGPSGDEYAELEALHTEVLATMHGHEAVVVDAARRRKLDTRAGVNFTLLAAHQMLGAPCRAPSLALRPLQALRKLADERLRSDTSDSIGHVQQGVIALREGRFRNALKHFERANELSPEDFAPLLGKGAALELEQQDVLGALKRLPEVSPLEGLERVFPDWSALTDRERRVVHASAFPLRQFLPHLAQAGYHVRILPLDVRASDLPELAEWRDERAEDDHRAFEALHGVAVGSMAIAKIEGLLSLAPGAHGWVLAHEFAHLVYFSGPAPLRARIQTLLRRASLAGYIGSEYQKQNEDEFFACAYTEYLARRYGLDAEQQMDDGGISREILSVFEELDAAA
ncbi:hypothetical protein SYV04_31535 [Hyalangium sp. s54d21]|uniref:Tetratricopeptide repeat protein n=1 Tax=Hyalangium rubrum TaxID=3103134 RepID=A0ABU5HBW6_9BACT|nr:hypothetical protein [Hyalangium sp. s54d21]